MPISFLQSESEVIRWDDEILKNDSKLHIVWFHSYEMSRIGKSTETKSRLVVEIGVEAV